MKSFLGLWACLFLATSQLLATVNLLLAEAGQEGVLDNDRLRLWCIVGSIGGAFLSLTVFTPNEVTAEGNARRYFTKLAASFLCGLALSPMIIDRLAFELTSTNALSVSFLTALFALSALHAALPVIEKWWARYLESKLPNVVSETPDEDA